MSGELQILNEQLQSLAESDIDDGLIFAKIEQFTKQMESTYPVELYMSYYKNEGTMVLDKIVVQKSAQKTGVGSKVMSEIIAFADELQKPIALTPDTSYGGSSIKRLTKFYKRFDFVSNRGRKRDYQTSQTMIRRAK